MSRWEYQSEEDRFWSKVEMRGQDDCWPWTGSYKRDRRGRKTHGQFAVYQDGKTVATPRASRMAYKLAVADPGFLHVLHKCNNPACCNPAHLKLGTNYENVQDSIAAGTKTDPPNNGKLSRAIAEDIRRLRNLGISPRDLAMAYGVSYQSIWAICSGRAYRAE